jgi:hypothetical protein
LDLVFEDQDLVLLDRDDLETAPDTAICLARQRRARQMAGHTASGEA